MTVKILLVDDHSIMREGLRRLLESDPQFEVTGEAEDGRMATQMVQDLAPQVVIMDVAMPTLNGMDATRQIVAASPETRVIALTMHSDERFVIGMLRAGAAGYLLKDCSFDELSLAINTVILGRTYLDPRVAEIVVQESVSTRSDRTPSPQLTAREREVLQLLAEGKTTKQTASCLGLSVKTIETHRRQTMEKLGVYSLSGLTKYAIREGLTSLAL